jgi:hypothetical protein
MRENNVENGYQIVVKSLKARGHLGDLVVDGRTILKWM